MTDSRQTHKTKRQRLHMKACIGVVLLCFVALVLCGDPNCQSGYISNPYNNNPAPRKIVQKQNLKKLKMIKSALVSYGDRIQKPKRRQMGSSIPPAPTPESPTTTFSSSSPVCTPAPPSTAPSSESPASSSEPVSTSTCTAPASSDPPTSAPTTTPSTMALVCTPAPTLEPVSTSAPVCTTAPTTSPVCTPAPATTTPPVTTPPVTVPPTSAPTMAPTTATPTVAPTTTTTTTVAPTTTTTTTTQPPAPTNTPAPGNCVQAIYSSSSVAGIKWNGFNTMQVSVCAPATSVVATYLDVFYVQQTVNLMLYTSSPLTFATTLAYSMLKVQNAQVTVTFTTGNSQTFFIENNQNDVDFVNVYYNQTIVPSTVTGPTSNVTTLNKNVTTISSEVIIGPHNDNRPESRCFFSRAVTATVQDFGVTCQLDCMTTFTWSGNVSNVPLSLNNQPVFTNCTNRYYTYGAHVTQGCINPNAAGTKLATLALNICTVINKCTLAYVPPSDINGLYAFVASGKGNNVFNASRCGSSAPATIGGTPTPTLTMGGASGLTTSMIAVALFVLAMLFY